MVENAANFTFTSAGKPSLFEVIAQKSLSEALYPAYEKLSLFLVSNCPQWFDWLGKYYDELFLVLNYAVEHAYLKQYDATFSENFYDLKRIPQCNTNLTDHHRKMSLIFTVLLPYFKRKLDEKVALYRLENADGYLHKNFEGHCKKFLIATNSIFDVIWTLLTVYRYIQYISGQIEVQLPVLQLIGLKYTYAEHIENRPTFWSSLFKCHLDDLWQLSILKSAATSTFEVGAFFLQFLQAWNSRGSNYSLTALPLVQAPAEDNKAGNYMNKCPICLQHWKIPTVLPVSGYVFCFPCILRFLREQQKCPITHLPAKPLDIVRLYDNE